MPFEKGKGGRPKGSPNRSALFVRQTIEGALGNSLPATLTEKILKLQEKDQIYYFERLMKYCYPTLTATEISGDITVNKDATAEQVAEQIKAALGRK